MILPEQIPEAIRRTVDAAAGKEHSLSGPVMQCVADILTMQDAASRADERRRVAERVLLVSELALGYRCAACHGQPAVYRWKSGRKRRYVCGCGHRWDALNRSQEWRAGNDSSTAAMLRKVAKTGELPELPAKTERDIADA